MPNLSFHNGRNALWPDKALFSAHRKGLIHISVCRNRNHLLPALQGDITLKTYQKQPYLKGNTILFSPEIIFFFKSKTKGHLKMRTKRHGSYSLRIHEATNLRQILSS